MGASLATYIAAAGLVFAAAAQVSGLPLLTGPGVAIDLVLLLVVAWGIIRGVHEGLLWGLIGGLALDVMSAVPFGTTTAALGIVGMISGLRLWQSLRGSLLWPLFVAVVVTAIYNGLMMALLALFGREWPWQEVVRQSVVPAAAWNAATMLPIYGLILLIHKRTEPKTKW